MGSVINPNERQTWAITASGITVMGKTKSYNTYEEMLRSPDPGLINYVIDASGDPTVNKGFAVYRYSNGIFTKIYEGEMMDPDLGMVFDWSKIVNGPSSDPADIDAAVAQKHEHPNMETLNALSSTADDSGAINALMINGILLATKAQIDELTAKVSGALSFKGVVENEEALPTENNQVGDVYVTKDGKEFVFTGDRFEEFGSTMDLSGYYTKEEIDATCVKFQPNGDRKFILLNNYDNIVGKDTKGTAHNLVMVSKWDVADFGSASVHMNLNSKDAVTVNDKDTVLTNANFSEFITIPSTEGFATETALNDALAKISKETEERVAADSSLTTAIGMKQNAITVDGEKLTLNNDVLGLGADVVVMQNPWDPNLPNRRHIVLKNHDSVVGTMTNGDNGSLIMMSKWDKVDIGTIKAQMNLNSPNGVVQVNDNAVVVTSDNISQYAPATDLGDYYTKGEVDAKVAGVLHYKGVVATKDELNAIEAPAVGDVYHVTADKGEYAFDGSAWEALGSEIDLSTYALKEEVANQISAAKDAAHGEVETETNARIAADEAMDNRITTVQADLSTAEENLNEKIEGKVDKVDGKSLVDDTEIIRLATVTNYDDTEVKLDITVLSDKVNTASGNVISISDRLVALEAQMVALKQTDIATVTTAADLSQEDKDLVITIAEPISGTTTVAGKSIEVKQLTTNNATTIFKTTGDVTMKNLTTTGDLPKATANAQIRIVSGDYIRITDSAVDQTGYNAIEIGLGTGNGPMPTKSITIDNVKFNSTLSNNAILVFATEDGSVVTISNCTFTKCSNPVRLSNAKGGKVTLNLVNCEFTEWDSDNMWAGIVIMQDYTSKSVEAIKANNLFGPDKVTINLINCTHAGKKITMPEDIATVCGTNDAATQLFYIWSNEEGLVAYDADRYPVINIQ